ncbi:MAG: aspartate 1-decarboxylase [Candidatus Brocadiia bacterium]
MLRELCKSKIHRVHATDANLNYEGSITIDRVLMDAADILPYEKVQVVDVNNGVRFETYTIEGEKNSGTICINGAAARLVQPGDVLIVISYGTMTEDEARVHRPRIVRVDANNRIVPS